LSSAVLVGGRWERDRAQQATRPSGTRHKHLAFEIRWPAEEVEAERGFGFIERDDRREVFVRITVLQAIGLSDRNLRIGDRLRLLRGSVAMLPILAGLHRLWCAL